MAGDLEHIRHLLSGQSAQYDWRYWLALYRLARAIGGPPAGPENDNGPHPVTVYDDRGREVR